MIKLVGDIPIYVRDVFLKKKILYIMPLQQPTSINECVYLTRRSINLGTIMVFVFKKDCPKCKTLMGKPKDKKGNVMIRAKEYICSNCGYRESKEEYESSLIANAIYKCHHCGFDGEAQTPFIRKNIGGIPALRFICEKCKAFIDVTKKMKEKRSSEEENF